jgi:hypothetical protein
LNGKDVSFAFAKLHNIGRAFVNMVLNGKRPVGDSFAAALGLRKVYIATSTKN